MRLVLSIVGQIAVLVILAGVVGLATNPLRGKNQINLERDYRPKPVPTRPAPNAPEPPAAPEQPDEPQLQPAKVAAGDDDPNAQEPNAAVAAAPAEIQPTLSDPNNAMPFQVVDMEDVRKIYLDDRTAYGMNVFVDARPDAPFEAGHIPGAVQCDYYRLDFYIDSVLARVAGAEKVIVYCNGGDCEDSLHVCGELLNYEVPWHSIYLFKGGWEAWKETDLPIETGSEGGSQ